MAEQRKREPEQDAGARMRREAWEAREARRRTARLIKYFLGVVVLGVATGLGIVYKDQIIALLNRQPPPVVVAPPPKPQPPVAVKQAEPTPAPAQKVILPEAETKRAAPAEVLAKVEPATDDAAVKALIGQGAELVEQLEFGKAAELFQEAAQKKISPAVRSEVQGWEKKAEEFNKATRHIPVSRFALADTSYVLQMNDGREMQGLKKAETETEFVLIRVPHDNPATTGEASFPLPKTEIAKIVPVTRQQRQEEFLQMLGQIESSASIQRSTDYYDLVYISKRLGLAKECMAYLNRAYNGGPGHAADPYLGDSFRKERIRRTIDQCSLMLAAGRAKRFATAELNKLLKMFPDYQVAQDEVEAFNIQVLAKIKEDFKSTLKEVRRPDTVAAAKKADVKLSSAKEMANAGEQIEQIEVVVENEGVQGHGAAAAIVEQANTKFDEGMKSYRRFRLGTNKSSQDNKSNNDVLKETLKLLEEAVALYDKALREDPGNKAVLNRQTEANMIVYACRKYQTL
ncbi:MAG: hypothetical protein ABSE73_09670 [Planctomycetota bacterium]